MKDSLLWLALLGAIAGYIIVRFYIRYIYARNEGFEVTPNLSACPPKTNEYTDNKGSINCCEGEVVGKKCMTNPVCTLSSSASSVPRCVDYVSIMSGLQGMSKCPKTLPNYFEREGASFCTADQLNDARNGPIRQDSKTCAVLKDQAKNMTDPNSCLNMKMMEDMRFDLTSGPYEKFSALDLPNKRALVFGAHYDVNGSMMHCYDKTSIERSMDQDDIHWRSRPEKRMKFTNYNFCTAADNAAKAAF
jgi:hypothetical protein